jgi:hypothetical protein
MVTQGVSNYLVPATSSPNAYLIRGTFSAAPEIVNFSNISLNGLAFRPSGVIIDNTAGTGSLNILIPEMSFNISCPAGASLNMPYPAPMNHTASITGLGDATVIFVDYPLQPYSSVQASGTVIPNPLPVTATAPLNVNISTPNPVPVSTNGLTDTELRATPVPVSVPNPLPVSGGITNSELRTSTDTFNVSNTSSTTTGNTVAAFEVSFLNSGTANATVAGGPLPPNFVITYRAPIGAVINPIAYDATGTTLNISTIIKV